MKATCFSGRSQRDFQREDPVDVFIHWFIAGLVSDWAFEVVAFKEVTADWKSDEMSSTRHGSRSVWLSDLSNWMVYWQERVQIKTIKFIVNSIYTMIICHLHELRDERVLEWITHLSHRPPWFRSSNRPWYGRLFWWCENPGDSMAVHWSISAPASRPRRVWHRRVGHPTGSWGWTWIHQATKPRLKHLLQDATGSTHSWKVHRFFEPWSRVPRIRCWTQRK